MADLSAVKTGDRLKVDCLVTETDLTSRIWCLRVGDDDTVLIEKAALEEAAEHIPAPRVFKRGDWVKWNDGEDDFRHCIVLGKSETGHSELLRVDVPGEGVCELYPRFLEPDEAPE